MSCYTRHLDEFLPPSSTSAARRALDDAFRVYLGMPNADCPEVWAVGKERRDGPPSLVGVRAAMREND
jgi:hypothetical protein